MLTLTKVIAAITWAPFSLLIAQEPPSSWEYTRSALPWLALWLLTWVAGILLWILLSPLWRRFRVPDHSTGKRA